MHSCYMVLTHFFLPKIPLIEEELTVTRYGYDTQKADQEDVREILTAVKTIKLVIFFDLVGVA